MGLISWIVIGTISGMLARRIVPGPDPGRFIVTLIVGMAGVSLGGFVMGVLGGSGTTGFSVWSVMMATKVTLPEQIRYDDGVEYPETELAPEKGKLWILNESSRKE
jgi:uncharacterized membrane protein YeaQ/YmgE (transglycosylase-associated protein family)